MKSRIFSLVIFSYYVVTTFATSVTINNTASNPQVISYYAWLKTDPCTVVAGGSAGTVPAMGSLTLTVPAGYIVVWYGFACPGGGTGNTTLVRVNSCQSFTFGFFEDGDSPVTPVTFSCGPPQYCATLNCVNTDSRPWTYSVYSNSTFSSVVLSGVLIDSAYLPSGGQYYKTICGPTGGPPFTLFGIKQADDGTMTSYVCWATDATNSTPAGTQGNFQNTNAFTLGTNMTPFYDSSTNIVWHDGTTNMLDSTGKQGLSAVYDAVMKGNNSDAVGLSNVVAAIDGMTNHSGGTNQVFANYSKGTNITQADGIAALGAADTLAGTLVSDVGSGPGLGAGSTSPFSFAFVTGTINLDPEVNLPGIGAICRQMFGWAATFTFLWWFGHRYWEASKVFATVQTGGVPDLNAEIAGFGGNALGVIAALAIPLVLIGLWVAVLTFVINFGITAATGSYWTANPFSGMSGGAAYLLGNYFPVSYIMGLGITSLGLLFGMGKLVSICSAASRFLFGR